MDFSDIGKRISQMAQEAMATSPEQTEVIRLKGAIRDLEKEISSFDAQVGSYVLSQQLLLDDPYLRQVRSHIQMLQKQVQDCKSQIIQLRPDLYCPQCGAELKQNSRFCESCGMVIVQPGKRYCPTCGSETGLDASFCGVCGTPLPPANSSMMYPQG